MNDETKRICTPSEDRWAPFTTAELQTIRSSVHLALDVLYDPPKRGYAIAREVDQAIEARAARQATFAVGEHVRIGVSYMPQKYRAGETVEVIEVIKPDDSTPTPFPIVVVDGVHGRDVYYGGLVRKVAKP